MIILLLAALLRLWLALYGIWNLLMWIWSIDDFYKKGLAAMAFALLVCIYCIYRLIKSNYERKRDEMYTKLCFDCAKDFYKIEGNREDYAYTTGKCQLCESMVILLLKEKSNRKKIEAPDDTTFSSDELLNGLKKSRKESKEDERQRFIDSLVLAQHRKMIEEAEAEAEAEK